MFTLSSLALLLVGIAQVMIGFLLPFYLQDVLHLKPSFIGLLFVSAPIFTVTLSPLVGWAVDKVGPRLPATVGISFLAGAGFFGSYLRADSHWLAAVRRVGAVGLGHRIIFYLQPYGDDYLGAGAAPRRCHRRDLRHVRLGHDLRCFARHHAFDPGISLLQRRPAGHADGGKSRDICSLDEF